MYLATPREVAAQLKRTCKGRGDTVLYEHHQWSGKAHAAGTVDELPAAWRFSAERVELLLDAAYRASGGV